MVDTKTLEYIKYIVGLDRYVEENSMSTYKPIDIIDAFCELGYEFRKDQISTVLVWTFYKTPEDKVYLLFAYPLTLTYTLVTDEDKTIFQTVGDYELDDNM